MAICVRACVWAGLGEHRAEQVTSVSYCARDGCCWHDERPIPGEEEWQGRTPAKRGARIGLLLTLSNKTEHAKRYGKITVFCDDERLGEMDAGQNLLRSAPVSILKNASRREHLCVCVHAPRRTAQTRRSG